LTTVEDYGKFLVSIIEHEGLTAKVFNDMVTQQVATKKTNILDLDLKFTI